MGTLLVLSLSGYSHRSGAGLQQQDLCWESLGTLLLLPPGLGMPQREAQLLGPGPGIFGPHMVPVMAQPMPASCVRGRDGLPALMEGGSTPGSCAPLSLPQRRWAEGSREGKQLLLGCPLKLCL